MTPNTETPPDHFGLGDWQATGEWVGRYLDAVGDSRGEYLRHGLVPPLALTARVLGALLEHLQLPPGAIHSLQEMEVLNPLEIGSRVTGVAHLEPARRRNGLQFTTVSYTITNADQVPVQTGKTTVLVPTAAVGTKTVGTKDDAAGGDPRSEGPLA